MNITETTPHSATLKELGRRVVLLRKQQGLSQAEMAEEAGLGVATVHRIEAGQDAQFSSWLKLFNVLGITSQLDVLLPEEILSPMAEVKKRRKKFSRAQKGKKVWGDGKS